MAWVKKRIQKYREGENPGFLEKFALEHGHPLNFLLHILAFISFTYGVYYKLWVWILVALLLIILGHLWCKMER